MTSSEEAVRYYEKVFAFQVSKKDADQQRLMTPTKGSNLAQKMADDRRNITAANAIAKMGAGVAAKNGGAKPTQPKVMLGQVTGFRLVDTEEFVIGKRRYCNGKFV